MKKLILIAVFALTTSIVTAQVSFGIHVGGNFAFTQIKQDDINGNSEKEDTDPKIGVKAGVVANIPLGPVSFCPGINFVQKGFKIKSTTTTTIGGFTSTTTDDTKTTLNYVEIPLNFAYSIPVGDSKVYFGLGPVIGLGISGKSKGESTNSTTGFPTTTDKFDYKIKFDGKKYDPNSTSPDPDGHLKRFNIGADVMAGFRMSMGIFVQVGYTYDFMNIDPEKDTQNAGHPSFKTSGVSLSVGYMIGGSSESSKKKSN
ncbi:MAG: porin family protein [Ferruginibacter sp.]